MTVTLKAKALEAFVADVFVTVGCSKDKGGRIRRHLVSAKLSGHDVLATRGVALEWQQGKWLPPVHSTATQRLL